MDEREIEIRSQRRRRASKQRKPRATLLVFAALCGVLSFGSGCQTTVPDAPVKLPTAETPQDEALSKSVRSRLLSVKTLNLSGVKIVSSSGTVYLTGTVDSLDARQQAIKLAWTVAGVQSVVNALDVRK